MSANYRDMVGGGGGVNANQDRAQKLLEDVDKALEMIYGKDKDRDSGDESVSFIPIFFWRCK